jgi:hypothetical protein
MGKTPKETQCKVKTTHFDFSFCVKVFIGNTAHWWEKDFGYMITVMAPV